MATVIRIVAINHQDGGLDPRPGGGRDTGRLDAQLDLLRELGADVIYSTEAKGWLHEDNRVLGHAATRLNMLPHLARAPRHDCNLLVWLRPGRFHDIEERHEEHAPFWHAQPRVTARLDGLGERLTLFAAHFSPFVPQIRTQEAYATLDLVAGDALVIGGGDFQDDPSPAEAPERGHMNPARRLRYSDPGGPTSPAELFRTAEMIDVADALGVREPTAGFNNHAPLRCDRFHISRRLADTPRSYRVHPDPQGLSDHRIIEAELDLAAAR